MAAEAIAPVMTAAGLLGQGCFFARFFLQWLASEKARASIVPRAFWWFSLGGSILVGGYALQHGEPVLLVSLVVGAAIALRNLSLGSGRRLADAPWLAALALLLFALLIAAELLTSERILGESRPWTALALLGQALWVARFPLQWWASERSATSHFPRSFWWTSLAGNLLLLTYALHIQDAVFVLGFLPGPLLQVRNLVLARRSRRLAVTAQTSGSPALPFWRRVWSGDLVPALLLAALGLGIVCVRPPLPIDETRYLEVLRENLGSNPLLLRLQGAPYAEKPPLPFWLARSAGLAGVAPELALRCLPALASALCVLFAGRIARRAGLELAGWLQAALLLPFLSAQYLLFDPLLVCAVWWALDSWTRGRDGECTLAAAAAFLAKGPVALLFLVPFFWSLAPLRSERAGLVRRAAGVLALGLVPLVTWAVLAAALGGNEFASELLWNRWSGRVVHSFAHRRSLFFYVPILLVGALPCTPLFLGLARARAEDWMRRTLLALAVILVAFTAISGKQAHYLLPLAPAVALSGAWLVERTSGGLRALRRGAWIHVLFLLGVVALGAWNIDRLGSFGPSGREVLADRGWVLPLGFAATALLFGALAIARPRAGARALLASVCLASALACLALHRIAGRILYPHELEGTLVADRGRALAYVGSSSHGIYRLLSERDDIVKLEDPREVARWSSGHPGGLIIVDESQLATVSGLGLESVAGDVVHHKSVVVLRARPGS